MDSPTSTLKPGKNRLLRWAIISVLVLVLLGLMLFYGPRYLARYVIASQLDELHIDHSGVETLIINPFTRELWLGPVSIGGGKHQAARLESLGVTLGYDPLLKHRIFIERIIVKGIDLVIQRDKTQRLIINEVPLDKFQPSSPQPPPAPDEKAWQPGVATLELRDSRLIFREQTGGELKVEVEHLSLQNFLAWEPDHAGLFELQGRVNDIQLNWTGQARPFAKDITLSIDSQIANGDLPKLERFTGSLGFDKRGGTYDAKIKHELTLFQQGGLQGHSQGVIKVNGMDYARADEFSMALAQANGDLDLSYKRRHTGDLSLQGKLKLDLGPSQVSVGQDTRIAVTGGQVNLDKINTSYGSEGGLKLDLRPEIDLSQVDFSGPIEISADKLFDLLVLLQSLSAKDEISTADTGLADFSGGAVALPSSDIKVDRLRTQGESLSLQSVNGRLDFQLVSSSDLSDILITANGRKIEFKGLQSALKNLHLESGEGRLAIDLVGQNALQGGYVTGPNGKLRVASIESDLQQFGLQAETGSLGLQLAGSTGISGFNGLLYAKEKVPELRLELGGVQVKTDETRLESQGDVQQWRTASDVSVEDLRVAFARGFGTSMAFKNAQVNGFQADQELQLSAGDIAVDGLNLDLKRSLLEILLKRGTTAQDQNAGTAPALEQVNELTRAQTLLKALGYEVGTVDGHMGERTAAAIEAFQKHEGITVNGRMSPGLLAQLELRSAESQGDESHTGLDFKVGHLTLTGEPVVRFHDDVVNPDVKIDSQFKTFEVTNLSLRAGEQPTDVKLAALVNNFTNLEVQGQTKGLNKNADVDLNLQVNNLELSTYSPYVVQLSGVYLDSGQLDTKISTKVKRGLLQGGIKVDLDNITFKPLSPEDAARTTETVGVPLETAVSLLQDNDGRIALNLPVSGTLSKPDVDISSAVSKAIAGVLKRIFPPTLAVSLLSKLGKVGDDASFEPIIFAPGSVELDATGKSYLDEVAKFMSERPKVTLKVCGRATEQDAAQLTALAESAQPAPQEEGETVATSETQQAETAPAEATPTTPPQPDPAVLEGRLKEIAVERKNVARAYLITAKGIDAKRVPECRSSYSAEDKEAPRAVVIF